MSLHKPPYAGTKTGLAYQIADNGSTFVLSPGIVSSETGSFASTNTPNFRSYKNRRDLPWRNFSASLTTETRTPGSVERYQGSPWFRFSGWHGYCRDRLFANYSQPLFAPNLVGVEYEARSRILAKLKDSSVNLAQAFAERKQTVNLISKNVNRLASAALAIRRGNLRHASNLFGMRYSGTTLSKELKPSPSNLSNYWLEYSYGWRPLLSDIHGSMELLAKIHLNNRPLRVTSSSFKDFEDRDRWLLAFLPNTFVETCDAVVRARARYVIEFREDSQFAARMSSTGVTDPALLAWELLPYSFVVDWFLPVGTYLKNLSATRGLSFYRGSLTRRNLFVYSAKMRPVGVPLNPPWIVKGLTREILKEEKSRVILSTFPSPAPVVPTDQLGIAQSLSGLALLIQAFKR